MKKRFIFITLALLMLLPLGVKATSIEYVSMTKAIEKTVGDEFSISFKISFRDLKMGTTDTEGVYMAGVEFSFDESVLSITGITSQGFESTVYKDDETGNYYVISIVDDSNHNRCVDEFLHCADYLVTLKFYVKETDKTQTDIKAIEYVAGTFKVDPASDSYLVEDMKELEFRSNEVQTVKIKQAEKEAIESPPSIIEEKKPEINNETITDQKTKTSEDITTSSESNSSEISSNRYLKSLIIENYDLELKKDKYTYKLTLPVDVNSLKITVEPEDEKATYTITGADDLKKNNNKVKILVTAENGEKVTYTINIERKEESNEEETTTKIVGKLNSVVIIVAIAIVLITVIALIVSYNNKKKLRKLLDEYNKQKGE